MLFMVSYILINLLAALNFASVFLKIKKTFGKYKNVKNVKRDKNKKTSENVFLRLCLLLRVPATPLARDASEVIGRNR